MFKTGTRVSIFPVKARRMHAPHPMEIATQKALKIPEAEARKLTNPGALGGSFLEWRLATWLYCSASRGRAHQARIERMAKTRRIRIANVFRSLRALMSHA